MGVNDARVLPSAIEGWGSGSKKWFAEGEAFPSCASNEVQRRCALTGEQIGERTAVFFGLSGFPKG